MNTNIVILNKLHAILDTILPHIIYRELRPKIFETDMPAY